MVYILSFKDYEDLNPALASFSLFAAWNFTSQFYISKLKHMNLKKNQMSPPFHSFLRHLLGCTQIGYECYMVRHFILTHGFKEDAPNSAMHICDNQLNLCNAISDLQNFFLFKVKQQLRFPLSLIGLRIFILKCQFLPLEIRILPTNHFNSLTSLKELSINGFLSSHKYHDKILNNRWHTPVAEQLQLLIFDFIKTVTQPNLSVYRTCFLLQQLQLVTFMSIC